MKHLPRVWRIKQTKPHRTPHTKQTDTFWFPKSKDTKKKINVTSDRTSSFPPRPPFLYDVFWKHTFNITFSWLKMKGEKKKSRKRYENKRNSKIFKKGKKLIYTILGIRSQNTSGSLRFHSIFWKFPVLPQKSLLSLSYWNCCTLYKYLKKNPSEIRRKYQTTFYARVFKGSLRWRSCLFIFVTQSRDYKSSLSSWCQKLTEVCHLPKQSPSLELSEVGYLQFFSELCYLIWNT